ncbi:hypothetical protein [Rudanella lutea]|uniref:hypothetical protein n=1 Tax=Rudanella lutea TaxID=451374 RepID=UPI00035D44C2|nr:hypothetical protein [Rudanella lutea]
MKRFLLFSLALLPLLLTRCGVSRQLTEAKALGDCRYAIRSADSITLAGYDIRQFRNMKDMSDFNPVKYPRIAAGLLTRNVPLDARINLGITNPTNRNAAINQLEYRILLAGQELFNGFINQRVAVPAGGGQTVVPIKINANAFQLLTDAKTRDAFAQFVSNLAGSDDTKASRVTIKIKPTLDLGNKAIDYPGYITIEQDVTNKILFGQ